MIELAKRRQSQYAKQIEFCVADATDRKSILELKRNRAFASFNGDNINQKKLDFELIKNTYKDVVDIITFDELVQRFDRIISFL